MSEGNFPVTPNGNKVLWSGPHLGGHLIIAYSPEIEHSLVYVLDVYDIHMHGTVEYSQNISPIEQLDVIVEMISKLYGEECNLEYKRQLSEGRLPS